MSWDFETEPEFQAELDWIEKFVRKEVEPLDYVLGLALRRTRSEAQQARASAAGRSASKRSCGHAIWGRSSAGRATGR